MRKRKLTARRFGLAVMAAVVGCLAPGLAKADYPYGHGYGGYGWGYGGYGGSVRRVPGGGVIVNRPGDGLPPIYNRRGDGLPPMPAHRLPGGGWIVNRRGDGLPPMVVGRPW